MTDNQEQLIKEAVEKALQGDMDAVNNIEDRVTRSKAKAALIKAKREATKTSAEPLMKNYHRKHIYNCNRKSGLILPNIYATIQPVYLTRCNVLPE